MGNYFYKKLLNIPQLKNIRQTGLLIAFDFENQTQRDQFYKKLYYNGMLCNPTGSKSIRLRPNLAVKKSEINKAVNLIKKSLNN